MQRSFAFFTRRINWKILLAAVALMIFFLVFMLPREAARSSQMTESTASADTSLFYSASRLYEIAGDYGPEGRTYYIRSRFTFDIAWPLTYLFFLVASLAMTLRHLSLKNKLQLVPLLPFAAFLLDILENSLVSIVFFRYPARTPVIADLAGFITLFKWVFLGLSFLLLAAGLILLAVRKAVSRGR